MKFTKFALLCVFAFILAGCASFNDIEVNYQKTTTTGQELIDIQKAKDSGAITEDQYNNVKECIIKNENNMANLGKKKTDKCKK